MQCMSRSYIPRYADWSSVSRMRSQQRVHGCMQDQQALAKANPSNDLVQVRCSVCCGNRHRDHSA